MEKYHKWWKYSRYYRKWSKTRHNRYSKIKFQVCILTLTGTEISYEKGSRIAQGKANITANNKFVSEVFSRSKKFKLIY